MVAVSGRAALGARPLARAVCLFTRRALPDDHVGERAAARIAITNASLVAPQHCVADMVAEVIMPPRGNS